jgi:prevent-host-death family protein
MRKMSTAQARDGLADVVNDAAYGGTRTVITRRGKDIAAIVPISDLQHPEVPPPTGMVITHVKQVHSPIAITSPTVETEAPITITIGDTLTNKA